MEAFLSLYDSTKDTKWLDRARAAADFAESWIWIWNLPMPLDVNDSQLYWKEGVPTIGAQGITALHAGSADEYLDWAVPSYARLYNYTHDEHYLDVARILLHDTKSMVSLPGRQYDMKGIGWQQEGWRFGPGGPGRGGGGHRFWLPWISSNHLYGITGLEEYDPALFKKLCTKQTRHTNKVCGQILPSDAQCYETEENAISLIVLCVKCVTCLPVAYRLVRHLPPSAFRVERQPRS